MSNAPPSGLFEKIWAILRATRAVAPKYKYQSDSPPRAKNQLGLILVFQTVVILVLIPLVSGNTSIFPIGSNETFQWNLFDQQQVEFSRLQVNLVSENEARDLLEKNDQLAVIATADNKLNIASLSPDWTAIGPLQFTSTDQSKFLSSQEYFMPEWKEYRFRLGDAIEVNNFQDYHLIVASTHDERFYINEQRENAQPQQQQESIPDSNKIEKKAELPGIRQFFMRDALAAAREKDSVINSPPPVTKTPDINIQQQEPAPIPNNPATNIDQITEQQNVAVKKSTPASSTFPSPANTSKVIITSATMMALSKADQKRSRHVLLPIMGENGLGLDTAIEAIAEGIQRISPQLAFVRKISLYSPQFGDITTIEFNSNNTAQTAVDKRESALNILQSVEETSSVISFFYLPKGPTITKLVGSSKLIWDDSGTLSINDAYRFKTEDSLVPFLAMLGLFLVLQFLRFSEKLQGNPVPRSMLFAFVLAAAIFCYLFYVMPSIVGIHAWLSTTAGLLLTACIIAFLPYYFIYGLTKTELDAFLPEATKTKTDELKTVLYKDTPIASKAQDRLGFNALVDALYNFLDNRDTNPPLTISVNGPWGSGKSSLMAMLENELKSTNRWQTIWFNAWRYEKQEQILAAFLKTITTKLSNEMKLTFNLRLIWVRFKNLKFSQYFLLFVPLSIVFLWFTSREVVEPFIDADSQTNFILALLGIGGSTWVYRLGFIPFKLQFKKLYDINDQSKRVGFLDQFTREFKQYREAAGNTKFLIIIDDLDRCAPDHIVEVLKTVNLITTSGDGADNSFFLLGYDRKYIIRSIEEHFKDYARDGDVVDANFGNQYLKKMVTLSVSIPSIENNKVNDLVGAVTAPLDQPEQAELPFRDSIKQILYAPLKLIKSLLSRLPVSAVLALLICVSTVYFLTHQSETFEAISKFTATATPEAQITTGEITTPAESLDKKIISLNIKPIADLPDETFSQWIPTISVLSLFIIYAFFRRYLDPTRPTQETKQESQDSTGFIDALLASAKTEAFPTNPRDAIRLANRMRFEFLIQDKFLAEQKNKKLSELESITYTLMNYLYPGFLNPQFVKEKILSTLEKTDLSDHDTLFSELSENYPEYKDSFSNIKKDIEHLESNNIDTSHFLDTEKLRTYVKLNKFLLEGTELSKGKSSENSPASADHQAPSNETNDKNKVDFYTNDDYSSVYPNYSFSLNVPPRSK